MQEYQGFLVLLWVIL